MCLLGFPAVVCAATPIPTIASLCNVGIGGPAFHGGMCLLHLLLSLALLLFFNYQKPSQHGTWMTTLRSTEPGCTSNSQRNILALPVERGAARNARLHLHVHSELSLAVSPHAHNDGARRLVGKGIT